MSDIALFIGVYLFIGLIVDKVLPKVDIETEDLFIGLCAWFSLVLAWPSLLALHIYAALKE